MDHYSILDDSSAQAGLEPAALNLVSPNLVSPNLVPPSMVPSSELPSNSDPENLDRSDLRSNAPSSKQPPKVEATAARSALRFPGEDGGKSLSEMAQRDLDATLQLLAERAQYITGASGAAIALRQGASMVCCASAGASAPELGAHLQIDSGLSAESVRTRKILICEDAENDTRVNRESCRAFGIASVVVMPLVRGDEVYGVFELLSGRPRAFEERDFVALNRLAEMIQTAVDYAEGARRAEKEFVQPDIAAAESEAHRSQPPVKTEMKASAMAAAAAGNAVTVFAAPSIEPAVLETIALENEAETESSSPVTNIEFGNLRRCETCGFPVSEGRRLCLDCEAAAPGADTSSVPVSYGDLENSNTSWISSHGYLIAAALVAAATIALLIWKL